MKYNYKLSNMAGISRCDRCKESWYSNPYLFYDTNSGNTLCRGCIEHLEKTDASFAIGAEALSGGQG